MLKTVKGQLDKEAVPPNGLTKKGFFSLLGLRLLEQQWKTETINILRETCLLLQNIDDNAQQSGWNQIKGREDCVNDLNPYKRTRLVVYSELCQCWPLVFKCSCWSLGLDCMPALKPWSCYCCYCSSHIQPPYWLYFKVRRVAQPVVRGNFHLQPVGGARIQHYSSLSPFLTVSLPASCLTHFLLFLTSCVAH